MKTRTAFLIICLIILPLRAFAADAPFRIEDRGFEIGLNADAHAANSFLSIDQLLRETVVIDLDELAKGFDMNLGINAAPLYFSIDSKKGWGFGLSTNVEAAGILGISGNLLSFKEADNDKSGVSGAIFASAGIDVFFHAGLFKVKIRPSVYYAIAYMKPDITYNYNIDNGTGLSLSYDMRIYTAFPLDGDNYSLTAAPGFDFSFGLEYPLSKAMGFDGMPLLDFDVGLDMINIPIVSSRLNNYVQTKNKIGSDGSLGEGLDGMFLDFDPLSDLYFGEGSVNVARPFRAAVWANWRLLGNNLLTLTPSIGFSINELYLEPFSIEYGLKARLDLANLFIVTAGVSYEDRMWVNSVDLALNFRAIELDVGVDIRSQEFLKSWDGRGVGVKVGLKFGW